MNDRLNDFAEQSLKLIPDGASMDLAFKVYSEKFAELMLKDCIMMCDVAAESNARCAYQFCEVKDVDSSLVSKGAQVQAEKLSNAIKKHFSEGK